MIQELEYYLPASLKEAYSQLQYENKKVVAGATDLIPMLRRGYQPIDTLVDISRLAGLDAVCEVDGEIRIGALASHHKLIEADLLQNHAESLCEAAASIGCPQTRNRGTLGGNIANGSPAADSLPPLLTYDATVHLGSMQGERRLSLSSFLLGPGNTDLRPGEMILVVSFRKLPGYGTAFVKLGKRNGMAISVASAAAACSLNPDGSIDDMRIALGSVAPTATRSPHAEQVLLGKRPDAVVYSEVQQAVQLDISPIDDVRASAEYRRKVAGSLVETAVKQALLRIGK